MGRLRHGQQQLAWVRTSQNAASSTQSQTLILQWKKAAEKVLDGGADLG